jgi:hypothetical protein
MKQEYTSAHTYKLNLNRLIIKILQFKIPIRYIRDHAVEIKW